jgi:hypothetical protein
LWWAGKIADQLLVRERAKATASTDVSSDPSVLDSALPVHPELLQFVPVAVEGRSDTRPILVLQGAVADWHVYSVQVQAPLNVGSSQTLILDKEFNLPFMFTDPSHYGVNFRNSPGLGQMISNAINARSFTK